MKSVILTGKNLNEINEVDRKMMRMSHLSKHRDVDEEGYLLHLQPQSQYSAVIDLQDDYDPFFYHHHNTDYMICFYGELYLTDKLKEELISLGYCFQNYSDNEIVLLSYIEWKEECLNKLTGAYAFVIDEGTKLFIARDPMGIKPLFYYEDTDGLVVSNQIKSILAYRNEAIVDENGIKELLGLGPSVSPGRTVYKDIYSLRPAHYMYYNNSIRIKRYWSLQEHQHTDTCEDTLIKLRHLIEESTISMLDDKTCTMLSGGVDSTILTGIASQNAHIETFSVTYKDQKEYFQSYDYQTTMDDCYIEDAISLYQCTHHSLVLSETDLINGLKDALIKRDYPGMADIDVSLMLFAKEMSKTHSTCLSGECADEILGGYPWFYKEELYNLPHFPWMKELDYRLSLLHDDIKALNIHDYIINKYNETLSEINTHDKAKQIMYLNMEWFMPTLLCRCEAMTSSYLKVRVPFASTQIAEYLYNIPKDMIMLHNEEKGLLRISFSNLLPPSILHRKKNPYPKTHSPLYKELICALLLESFNDSDNLLFKLFDHKKLYDLVEQKGETMTSPWFGQLMMGPQFIAYLYSIYLWGKIYHIQLQL